MSMDNSTTNRKGELGRTPMRSDRLFTQHEYWYFKTREGMDIGPFDSINEAIDGANEFVAFLNETAPETVSRITDYVTHAA